MFSIELLHYTWSNTYEDKHHLKGVLKYKFRTLNHTWAIFSKTATASQCAPQCRTVCALVNVLKCVIISWKHTQIKSYMNHSHIEEVLYFSFNMNIFRSYFAIKDTIFRNVSTVQYFSFNDISFVMIQCLFSKCHDLYNNINYMLQRNWN